MYQKHLKQLNFWQWRVSVSSKKFTVGWFGLVNHWFATQKNNDKLCKLIWKLKSVMPGIYFSTYNAFSIILHFYSNNWTWKESGNWCTKPASSMIYVIHESGFYLTLEKWHSMFQMIKANLLLGLNWMLCHFRIVCIQNIAWKCGKNWMIRKAKKQNTLM